MKGAIQFIDIEEADAIAKRIPALESIEVDQGAFGGRPPRPAESFHTLGYSIRLVATPYADNDTVAELMRHLYLIRQNISAAIPGAGLMEAPDLEEATLVPDPSGRADLCERRAAQLVRQLQRLHLSRAVPRQRVRLGRGRHVQAGWAGAARREPQVPARRLEAALDAVRDARTAEELDAAEREADAIFRSVFGMGSKGELSPERRRELRHGADRTARPHRGAAGGAGAGLNFARFLRERFCGGREPREDLS